MLFAICMMFVLIPNISVNAKNKETSVNSEKYKLVFNKYIELDKNLKEMVNYGFKKLLPYIMQANERMNLSSNCTRDLFQLFSGIRKLKVSDLNFLDAAGKIPSGLLTGTVQMVGDYDQCMTTSVLRKDGTIAFKGQYCMIYIRPLLSNLKRPGTVSGGLEGLVEATKNTSEVIQLLASMLELLPDIPGNFGLCVPSGCSSTDVSQMLNYLGPKVSLNATVAYCKKQDESLFSIGTIIAIFFFSLAGALALVASFLDYYSRKMEVKFQSRFARILLCFSILTNFPKVISTKTRDKSLASLNGVRCLSLFYIILQHDYLLQAGIRMQGHALLFKEKIPGFFIQIILNGNIATEVFFFLSGFLNIYIRMKQKEYKINISFWQRIVHRLWRIYPAYLFSIMAVFFFTTARGPMGTVVGRELLNNCEKHWWKNLMFINNFFPQREMCMDHGWYIAADMHLFFISLFTVPVLLRSAKKGIILHLGILIAGIIASVLWALHKNVMPGLIIHNRLLESDFYRLWNAYVITLSHIAPYFTGIIFGYIFSAWNDFKISMVFQAIGWSIASTCFISMLFMTQRWNSGVAYTAVESAFYVAFSRFLFVLAIAWMVLCCVKGYAGIVNYILSLQIWIPMARMCFMVYLISPLLQVYYFSSLRMLLDMHDFILIWRYMGTLAISFLMGLAMVVLIESPFISVENIIFQRKSIEEKAYRENKIQAQNCTSTNEKIEAGMELEKNIKNATENLNLKQ